MSDIVLTASVRQNLLSLQSTADLLATTQNRLATGKKVNSALDNPTNFFTAAGLDARASDINNLLDGIGNGVQVLQAANTGITSLQKLIDSAKSIANQALQTNVGYAKSSLTTGPNAGATGANLLGLPDTAATVTGAAVAGSDACGHAGRRRLRQRRLFHRQRQDDLVRDRCGRRSPASTTDRSPATSPSASPARATRWPPF